METCIGPGNKANGQGLTLFSCSLWGCCCSSCCTLFHLLLLLLRFRTLGFGSSREVSKDVVCITKEVLIWPTFWFLALLGTFGLGFLLAALCSKDVSFSSLSWRRKKREKWGREGVVTNCDSSPNASLLHLWEWLHFVCGAKVVTFIVIAFMKSRPGWKNNINNKSHS